MKGKEFYNVAVYLRLSRDDGDMDGGKLETPYGYTSMPCGRKAESNSISSQRDMIRSYIREHDDMEIYDIYVDDGWSGANFARVR